MSYFPGTHHGSSSRDWKYGVPWESKPKLSPAAPGIQTSLQTSLCESYITCEGQWDLIDYMDGSLAKTSKIESGNDLDKNTKA